MLDGVIASAGEAGRLENAANALFTRGSLRGWNGEPEAASELSEALRLAEEAGDIWLGAAAAATLGRTLVLSGDLDQGMQLLERSSSDLQGLVAPIYQLFILIPAAIGEIRTGKLVEARATLASGVELAELSGSPAIAAEAEHMGGRMVGAARPSCRSRPPMWCSPCAFRLYRLQTQNAEQETVSRVETASRRELNVERFEYGVPHWQRTRPRRHDGAIKAISQRILAGS